MADLRFLNVNSDGDVLIDYNLAASGLAVFDSDKSHYLAITATSNLTEELEERINNSILPKVTKFFERLDGKTNEKNTDCKLISTALAYSEDVSAGIFSNDFSLLLTFAYCAEEIHLPTKKTFIVDDRYERIIPTREYLRKNRRKKDFFKI